MAKTPNDVETGEIPVPMRVPVQSEDQVDALSLGFDAPMAAIQSGLSVAIPFYHAIEASAVAGATGLANKVFPDKIHPVHGPTVEQAARGIAALEAEHPDASAAGTAAGIATAIGTLGAFGGVAGDATIASRLTQIGSGTVQAGKLSPFINSALGVGGEAAFKYQLADPDDPLTGEKVLADMSIATALQLGLGQAGKLGGKLGGYASAGLKKLGINRASAALGLKVGEEDLANKILQSEYGSAGKGGFRAAEDRLKQVGEQMNEAVEKIPGKPTSVEVLDLDTGASKNTSPLADKLNKVADQFAEISGADSARNRIREAGKRLTDADSFKAVHEVQKDFAARIRQAKTPAVKKMLIDADSVLRQELEQHAPEMEKLSAEYGFLKKAVKATSKVANKQDLRVPIADVKVPIGMNANMASAILLDQAAKGAKKSGDAVAKTFGVAEGLSTKLLTVADYDHVIESVDRALADPRQFTDNLMSGLPADMKPSQKALIHARTINALDFLRQSMPKQNGVPLPGDLPDQPSSMEMQEFINAANGVFHPYDSVPHDTQQGAAGRKTVFPEITGEMTRNTLGKLADGPKMDYKTKLNVSNVIGMPLEQSQVPSFGARMQARNKAYKARMQESGQSGSARTAGSRIKADKAAVTRAQRVTNEEDF